MKTKIIPISFTQYEKTCKDHISEGRKCLCDRTGDLCNKMNCPHFNKEEDEK